MTNKFFVPAATMLGGLFVWIVFLVLREVAAGGPDWPSWLGAGVCLAAGGLIVTSGLRCRQVGGPRLGNIVRTGLLLVLAAVSCWRIGCLAAGVLAAAAIATGVVAMKASCRPEDTARAGPESV